MDRYRQSVNPARAKSELPVTVHHQPVEEGFEFAVGQPAGRSRDLVVRKRRLIGEAPFERIKLAAHPGIEPVAVGIGDAGVVVRIRDAVFNEIVAHANVPAVVEITGGTDGIDEVRFPVEGDRSGDPAQLQVERIEFVPIDPLDVRFEIPFLARPIGITAGERGRGHESARRSPDPLRGRARWRKRRR